MPDQPDDPLHYEMKIPPEKHKPDDDRDAEDTKRDEKPGNSATAKDAKEVHDHDKTQSERHPG
jgi:hypothetical protein